MSTRSQSTGYATFVLVLIGLVAGLGFSMKPIAKATISTIFPGYQLDTDVLSNEWVLYNLHAVNRSVNLVEAVNQKMMEPGAKTLNIDSDLMRKGLIKSTLDTAVEGSFTLYYIKPLMAFGPLLIFIAIIISFLASLFIGGTLMNVKLQRERDRLRAQLIKQCRAHSQPFEELLALDPEEREHRIRESSLPEVTAMEMDDLQGIQNWFAGTQRNPFIPIRFFFRYRISLTYGNVIQGLVSGGAAILIFVIGLRGLKIIPAEEPSIILMALSIEFILLLVLMLTFMGSMQEERLDRVVKELEAEQRGALTEQTNAINIQTDIMVQSHQKHGINDTAPDTLAGFEEQRLLDDVLSRLLASAERREKKG